MLNITDSLFSDNWKAVAVECTGNVNVGSTANSISSTCAVTIDSTTFTANNGGALSLSGVLSTLIRNTAFSFNHRTWITDRSPLEGGAISSVSCIQTIILNSTFIDNVSTNTGGAINIINVNNEGSSLSVSDCTFQRNQALFGSGGAVFVSGVSSVSVNSSSFTDCSAAIAGGSIFAMGPAMGSVYVGLCTFIGSLVGVLPEKGWLPTPDTVISPRNALTQLQLQGGGAVFLSSFKLVDMVDCVLESCRAVRSKGGGLRIRASVRADVKQTSFSGCQAAAAGALSVSSMLQLPSVRVGLQSNVFTNNSASMQLECPGPVCVDLDTTLVGTQGDGGAVSIDGCSLDLFNVNMFESNHASGRGGALFAQRPPESGLVLFESDYSSERSFFSAAGSVPDPFPIHTSFVNNSALGSGGAMALRGFTLDLGTIQDPLEAFAYTLFAGNVAPTGEHQYWTFQILSCFATVHVFRFSFNRLFAGNAAQHTLVKTVPNRPMTVRKMKNDGLTRKNFMLFVQKQNKQIAQVVKQV